MNFAFSAVVLIILLLPGATILKAYYTSFREKKSSFEISISDLLVKGLAYSFVIHTAALCVLRMFHCNVRLTLLYDIINAKDLKISDGDFNHALKEFSLYNLILIIIIWVVTKLLKKWIRQRNWDINYHALRNTNYWFHIFSARYLEAENVQGTQADTDLIFVDVLTKAQVIYSGFLKDFNYSEHKDELENLVLQNAQLRKFEQKAVVATENKEAPNAIPGDVFVIPMCEILNINIYYMKLQRD